MREIELKSVVDDLELRRRKVEDAGGRLVFQGFMVDRRYTRTNLPPVARDEMVRIRTYRAPGREHTELTWKGPTLRDNGYKVREELSTGATDGEALMAILSRLGFELVQVIERRVAEYACGDARVRFEQYPRMDVLVEVEGEPEAIERAIHSTELPRAHFTAERLMDFVRRFEARTGNAARLSRAVGVHEAAVARARAKRR